MTHDGIARLRAFMAEKFASRHHVPLEQRRAGLDALCAGINPLPESVIAERMSLGGVACLRFSPVDAEPDADILYLHGGAFVAGSAISHGILTANLALAARARVWSLEYRLAPESPFPAAPDDCIEAYADLVARCDAARFGVAGDSAGGALALTAMIDATARHLPVAAALALISPATDLTQSGTTYARLATRDPFMSRAGFGSDIHHYIGAFDPSNSRISPLFANLTGLPPTLIHVGSEEVLLSDAVRLAEAAGESGVAVRLEVWPEMVHAWHLFPNWLPEASRATSDIGRFFRRHWDRADEDAQSA